MIIAHLKLTLRPGCDMNAVREIVNAYENAVLDEDTLTVYYNTYPNKVIELVEELHPFKDDAKVSHETF